MSSHADEGTIIERLEQGLRMIADGYWNSGRKPEDYITANEYAAECLRHSGLVERAAVVEE